MPVVADAEVARAQSVIARESATPLTQVPILEGASLQGTRNDDEVAFVTGHEAGHHIAKHIDKQKQQELAGALILGMAAAYAGDGNPNQYQAQRDVENAMNTGAALGGHAYSQTYELEADILGAYIAEAARYDAEKGSLIFARRDGRDGDAKVNGAMSLWSTHPRSPQRLATVRYAVAGHLRLQGRLNHRPHHRAQIVPVPFQRRFHVDCAGRTLLPGHGIRPSYGPDDVKYHQRVMTTSRSQRFCRSFSTSPRAGSHNPRVPRWRARRHAPVVGEVARMQCPAVAVGG
jgi:hypothetical protein